MNPFKEHTFVVDGTLCVCFLSPMIAEFRDDGEDLHAGIQETGIA